MPETKDLFLGFDPGGHGRPSSKGKFGWSICGEVDGLLQERLQTGLAHDAWEAINQVKGAIASLGPRDNPWVRAAGIDAPLLWNKRGDRKGYRKADCVLRRTLRDHNLPTASVLAPNALYGAVVVQGPLLVRHLSATWDLAITESHPTVLERLLPLIGQPQTERMVRQLTAGLVPTGRQDPMHHRRDATLCAVSAWAMVHRPKSCGWQNLYDEDFGLLNPSQIPVGYWMPIPNAPSR